MMKISYALMVLLSLGALSHAQYQYPQRPSPGSGSPTNQPGVGGAGVPVNNRILGLLGGGGGGGGGGLFGNLLGGGLFSNLLGGNSARPATAQPYPVPYPVPSYGGGFGGGYPGYGGGYGGGFGGGYPGYAGGFNNYFG